MRQKRFDASTNACTLSGLVAFLGPMAAWNHSDRLRNGTYTK